MTGWWLAVFWLLLIPLIIVEIIVYLKTKKFYWLTYALSIFIYVVAVSYTIDAFSLGKNSIILILLASAGLMFAMGRQMGKKLPKKKVTSKKKLTIVLSLLGLMLAVFFVSVIFGKLDVETTSVKSVPASSVLVQQATDKPYLESRAIVVLTSTMWNGFFLPVPIKHDQSFKSCLVTNQGAFELSQPYYADPQEEIPALSSKTVEYKVQPYYNYDKTVTVVPEKLVIYKTNVDNMWKPCNEQTEVFATIAIE